MSCPTLKYRNAAVFCQQPSWWFFFFFFGGGGHTLAHKNQKSTFSLYKTKESWKLVLWSGKFHVVKDYNVADFWCSSSIESTFQTLWGVMDADLHLDIIRSCIRSQNTIFGMTSHLILDPQHVAGNIMYSITKWQQFFYWGGELKDHSLIYIPGCEFQPGCLWTLQESEISHSWSNTCLHKSWKMTAFSGLLWMPGMCKIWPKPNRNMTWKGWNVIQEDVHFEAFPHSTHQVISKH